MGSHAAPGESPPVAVDRHAIELDCPLDSGKAEGHKSFLKSVTQHEQVRRDGIADESRGEAGGVDKFKAISDSDPQGALHRRHIRIDVGIHDKSRRRRNVAVDDGLGRAGFDARQRLAARRNDHVAPQQQACAACGNARPMQIVASARQAHVTHDRAVLLGQAGKVEDRAAFALEMRRHAEQRSERHDAAAADPGDHDPVGLIERPHGWQRQPSEGRAGVRV